MYPERQQQLKDWLVENKYDFFLVTKPENVRWLTGFEGSFGWYWQGKKDGILISDNRYAPAAKQMADDADVQFLIYDEHFKERFASIQRGKIALEDTQTVSQYKKIKTLFSHADLSDVSQTIEIFRRTKDNEEQSCIRTAQAHVDQVLFPFLKEVLTEGVSEQTVTYRLKNILEDQGRYGLSFDPIVAFGTNTAVPHHRPNQTTLKATDCVLVDCGVTYQGYCSDMTRNVLFGSDNPEYRMWYEELLTIQNQTLQKCKEGVLCAELDIFVREQLGEKNKYFTYSLGHGVGLDIHEAPSFSKKSKDILQLDEVITIEPGIHKEGLFGIRIEDIGIVREDSFEVLSQTSKELMVLKN